MNQNQFRRWHRRTGLLLAPFLLLQGLSGLILSYGLYSRVASGLAEKAPDIVEDTWRLIIAKTHYGSGLFGWIYHSLVGFGLIWMICSGLWIWFDVWRKRRQGDGQE